MKRLIFPILLVFLLLSTVLAENPEAFYSIIINYDRDDFSLQDVKLVEGLRPNFAQEGKFSLSLLSFKEETLFSYRFDIPLIKVQDAPLDWFDDEGKQAVIPESEQNIEVKKASKTLFIPYFFNGKTIVIKDGDEIKLNIDVSDFAQCNDDGICSKTESIEMCPNDCLTNFLNHKISFWQWLVNLIKSIWR